MFPVFKIRVSGLDPRSQYNISLDIINDGYKYKFTANKWIANGTTGMPATAGRRPYPKSPSFGLEWEEELISFDDVKLTNNQHDLCGYVSLNLPC